ncbi:probable E3 ubiquitin-protein ligase RHC1A isoform X2 [Cynara cardunculus var. scolymus]|nr:probable E3 ubiquitin-protein ligase RHC1A isoform X2 [Cynara cardunculus var. scolymus]
MVVDGQHDFDPFHGHDVSDHWFIDPFIDSRNRIMDAFAELLRQRNLGNRRSSLLLEDGIVPWGYLMSADDEFECFFNGAPVGSRPSNSSNISMGTSFQELVEQLIANDAGQGPPPATRSAIDSLPTIRITNRHLNNDSNCPVCQDKFDLGSEARMMPCNHIYHSGCIMPWLLEHNSCPVCRLELPSQGTNGGSSTEDSDQNQGSRNPLSFLWPFHS